MLLCTNLVARNLAENTFKIFTGLAILGIIDAIYHAYSELTGFFNDCNISKQISCGSVFQYGYTTIAGVPFWLLGVIWFPLMLILGFVLWNRSKLLLIPILLIGNMFTIYLWYIDLGIIWPAIHAICPVCVSLYVINYLLTIVAAVSVYSDL